MRITIRAYARNATYIVFALFAVRTFAHVPVRVVTNESCSRLLVRGIVLCIPWPDVQHVFAWFVASSPLILTEGNCCCVGTMASHLYDGAQDGVWTDSPLEFLVLDTIL